MTPFAPSFRGKTAVITGAGSGIGRALAFEGAARGMNLVLADVNADDLAAVARSLSDRTEVRTFRCDVSRAEAVEALAAFSFDAFGKVHLLCNNAGVGAPPERLWETRLEDWEWVLGVNLWGVVHGVKSFVPRMLAQNEPAHVLNTASIAGLISNSRLNAYGVSKHAVVALSETLHLDLREGNAPIGVSVLCPAWVKTRIHEAQRNREGAQVDPATLDPATQAAVALTTKAVAAGLGPAELATLSFEAVRDGVFYILTHPPYEAFIDKRFRTISSGQAPTPNVMEPPA